jgi:hypothetical protein
MEQVERFAESVKYVDGEVTRSRFEGIDEKLDNDNRRFKMHSELSRSQQRFLILTLKAQLQILAHLSEGNHTEALKRVSDEIQSCLLEEATATRLFE